jgi:hypothetical protein
MVYREITSCGTQLGDFVGELLRVSMRSADGIALDPLVAVHPQIDVAVVIDSHGLAPLRSDAPGNQGSPRTPLSGVLFAVHESVLVFVDAPQASSLEIVFGDEGRYGHPPA